MSLIIGYLLTDLHMHRLHSARVVSCMYEEPHNVLKYADMRVYELHLSFFTHPEKCCQVCYIRATSQ